MLTRVRHREWSAEGLAADSHRSCYRDCTINLALKADAGPGCVQLVCFSGVPEAPRSAVGRTRWRVQCWLRSQMGCAIAVINQLHSRRVACLGIIRAVSWLARGSVQRHLEIVQTTTPAQLSGSAQRCNLSGLICVGAPLHAPHTVTKRAPNTRKAQTQLNRPCCGVVRCIAAAWIEQRWCVGCSDGASARRELRPTGTQNPRQHARLCTDSRASHQTAMALLQCD